VNILLFDDRESGLRAWLESRGHIIEEAINISQASDRWDARQAWPIDCIIMDLNMDPHGLSGAEKDQTRKGLLTGWIWLRDHVLTLDPKMRQRVVIYSAYLSAFRDYVPSSEREGLELIHKFQPLVPDELMARILIRIEKEVHP